MDSFTPFFLIYLLSTLSFLLPDVLVSYTRNHCQYQCQETFPLCCLPGVSEGIKHLSSWWVPCCVWCMLRMNLHSFHMNTQFSWYYLLNRLSFLLGVLLGPFGRSVDAIVSGLSILLRWSTCCLYTTTVVFYYYSFVIYFEVREYEDSKFVVLSQDWVFRILYSSISMLM